MPDMQTVTIEQLYQAGMMDDWSWVDEHIPKFLTEEGFLLEPDFARVMTEIGNEDPVMADVAALLLMASHNPLSGEQQGIVTNIMLKTDHEPVWVRLACVLYDRGVRDVTVQRMLMLGRELLDPQLSAECRQRS